METFNFSVAYTVSTATLDRLIETAVDQVVSELNEVARVNSDSVRDLCRNLIVNRLGGHETAPAAPPATLLHVPLATETAAPASNLLHVRPGGDSVSGNGVQQTIPLPSNLRPDVAARVFTLVQMLNTARWERVEKTGNYNGYYAAYLGDHPEPFAVQLDTTPERIAAYHHHDLIKDHGVFQPWHKVTTGLEQAGLIYTKPGTVTTKHCRQGQYYGAITFRLDGLRAHGFNR